MVPKNVITKKSLTFFKVKLYPKEWLWKTQDPSINIRVAIRDKTGKTTVLSWFCKIEDGGDGAPPCYSGLNLQRRMRPWIFMKFWSWNNLNKFDWFTPQDLYYSQLLGTLRLVKYTRCLICFSCQTKQLLKSRHFSLWINFF